MKTNIHLLYCIPEKLLELEMFQGNFVEEKKQIFVFYVQIFFSKLMPFLRKSGNIL